MNDIEQGRVSSVNKMIVGATNNLQIGAIGTDDEDEEEFECSNHKKNGVESDEECITQEDDSLQLDNLFAKRKYKLDKDIRNAVGGVVVDDNGASSTSLTMIDNLPIELGRSVNDNHINEDGLYHTSGSTTTTNGNVARIPSTDRNNSGDSSGGIGIGNIGNNRGAIRSLPPLSATIECGMCHIDRPRNAAHCHDCGLCVVKLDHHCPVSFNLHSSFQRIVIYYSIYNSFLLLQYLIIILYYFLVVDWQMHRRKNNAIILCFSLVTYCPHLFCYYHGYCHSC